MPRISDELRARRRAHILASAWGCFARDGFHATSMDDVIAATGMSSSAVYRYFRSKEELIDAAADEGLERVRDMFTRLLAADPAPGPHETLAALAAELRDRAAHPDYDLSVIIIQVWAEALRRPVLRERTQTLLLEARAALAELARRWRAAGQLPPEADADQAAAFLLMLMPGLIVTGEFLGETLPGRPESFGLAGFGSAWDAGSNPAG